MPPNRKEVRMPIMYITPIRLWSSVKSHEVIPRVWVR